MRYETYVGAFSMFLNLVRKCVENRSHSNWISRSKLTNISKTRYSKNDVFYDCVFPSILEDSGECLQCVLGGLARDLGLLGRPGVRLGPPQKSFFDSR